jgi:uncharacterized protein
MGETRNQLPFIQFFQTPAGRRYVYDVNTNIVIEADEITTAVLTEWRPGLHTGTLLQALTNRFAPDELADTLQTVRRWAKRGYFSAHRPQQFSFPLANPEIRDQLNGHINQLILCVTDDCNLRCKYCVYSGSYAHYRAHQPLNMSEQTASKALSVFFNHSTRESMGHISFYGGEPLLNFSLIQHCVAYCRANQAEKLLHFNITTNGTLLTDAVIDFLVANDFGLRISLDGPAHLHDANRVFIGDVGSHERIMENLHNFKTRYPAYFATKVSFISVVGWPYDMAGAYHFFQTNATVAGLSLSVEGVLRSGTTYFDSRPLPPGDHQVFSRLQDEYCRQMTAQDPVDPYLASLFNRKMMLLAKRDMDCRLGDDRYPNGICIPGVRRLFVDTGGRFQPCEKFNGTIFIGNVDSGFNYEAIEKLLQEYVRICQANCRDCWAQRLCTACFVACNGDGIDAAKKAEFCALERKRLLNNFILYFRILEQNPEAFAELKTTAFE